MLTAIAKTIAALWPLWLWLLVRYALGALAAGTVLYRAAQTAGPLVLFLVALLAHAKGASSWRTLVFSALGAVASGAVGLRWEYLLWGPYLGRPGYTPLFVLAHLDWPLRSIHASASGAWISGRKEPWRT